MDLLRIESPAFLKVLSLKELDTLANEVRTLMISSVSKTGGKLAENLSAVELTIGLHRVFNSHEDKLFFDVVDQSYVHKILTGRAKEFRHLRQVNGLSGQQNKNESRHDPYDGNVMGQALSIGYGYSMKNEADQIVVVLSPESLALGQVYEALNHISTSKKKIVIVINDNESMTKLGPLSTSMKNLMVAKPITQFRDDMNQFLKKGNVITKPLKKTIKSITTNFSKTVSTSNLFSELGLRYVGPFDGHSIRDIIRVLTFARDNQEPIVVHFKSEKGKGYKTVHKEQDGLWVDLNTFDINTGQQVIEYPAGKSRSEKVIVQYSQKLVDSNPQVVSVNTLRHLSESINHDKHYDVSQGHTHPLSFASGLALAGFRVIVYLDASQLLTKTSNLISEVSAMYLNMTLIDFYSGINDIETNIQTSLFEYPLLSMLPKVIISQGKNIVETTQLLNLSMSYDGPFVLRVVDKIVDSVEYPSDNPFDIGQWELLKGSVETPEAILFAYGSLVTNLCEKVESNQLNFWIVNCRFLNILDESLLYYLKQFDVSFFLLSQDYEFNVLAQMMSQFLANNQFKQTLSIFGLKKDFIGYGSIGVLHKQTEIDTQSLLNKVLQSLGVNP